MGDVGRRVYAVKAHVKDLPHPAGRKPHPQDDDGFVWLHGGTSSHDVCASWQKAKTYASSSAAGSVAASHGVFGRAGFNAYGPCAVPGRYTLVTMDTVVVDETVRTPATRAAS